MAVDYKVDYKTVGLRIKKLRVNKSWTQDKLAEKAGCSKSFVGCVENNTSIPSVDTIVQLANVLDVTPDYILLGTARDIERPQRIAQKIMLCRPEEQEMLETFIDAVIEKNSDIKK